MNAEREMKQKPIQLIEYGMDMSDLTERHELRITARSTPLPTQYLLQPIQGSYRGLKPANLFSRPLSEEDYRDPLSQEGISDARQASIGWAFIDLSTTVENGTPFRE